MSENFEIAHAMTSRFEGGYANSPSDTGGETIFGISRVYHSDWPGWVIVDEGKSDPTFPANVNGDPKLKEMAKAFYQQEFWEKINGDELPLTTALAVYDMAVNFDPKQAVKQLQVILGLNADGIVGQRTIKAAHDTGLVAAKELIVARIKRHFERVAKSPGQEVNLHSWIYRCVGLAMQIGRHLQ